VHFVRLGGGPERHPQEVLHQRQRVVGGEGRLADRFLEGVGRDRGQLGGQSGCRQFHLLVVAWVGGGLVVARQRIYTAGQHRHRVGVTREAVEESLQVLVQQRVPLDLLREGGQLILGRQFAVDQQIAHLDERRLLGQLLDRVAAVTENPGVTVDVRDGAFRRRGVHEAGVERGVTGLREKTAQGDAVGTFGGVRDFQLQLAARVLKGGELFGVG